MVRVPEAQPPPLKQIDASCTCVDSAWFWAIVGLPLTAFVTCAKKTCQSNGAVFGEVPDEPSQVTSTMPGLPATIHAWAAVFTAAPPLSTWTAVVQVGEAPVGFAVLARKTWEFVWVALSSDFVKARCRLPPRSTASIGKTPRLVVPAGPV